VTASRWRPDAFRRIGRRRRKQPSIDVPSLLATARAVSCPRCRCLFLRGGPIGCVDGTEGCAQGDLYCKNCFMRLFKVKGTYSVFSEDVRFVGPLSMPGLANALTRRFAFRAPRPEPPAPRALATG
jgi:hypothetical protein